MLWIASSPKAEPRRSVGATRATDAYSAVQTKLTTVAVVL
jgi:hypothetical protein